MKVWPIGSAPERVARGQVRLHRGVIPYVVTSVHVADNRCWIQFEDDDQPEDCRLASVAVDALAEPWADPETPADETTLQRVIAVCADFATWGEKSSAIETICMLVGVPLGREPDPDALHPAERERAAIVAHLRLCRGQQSDMGNADAALVLGFVADELESCAHLTKPPPTNDRAA